MSFHSTKVYAVLLMAIIFSMGKTKISQEQSLDLLAIPTEVHFDEK